MQRKAEDWQVQYISLMNVQCPNGECLNYADSSQGVVLLKDDNNLSDAGSALMIEKLIADGQLPSQGSDITGARMN